MNKFEVIILRGASGVGKTTLLKAIKSVIDESFCIDIDDIRNMLSSMDWDKGYTNYVNSQKIARAMIKEVGQLGYKRAIVADTFPYDNLCSFLSGCSFNCRIVNLYCNKDELERRLTLRGKEIIRIENILALNESIRKQDLENMPIPILDIIYIDNTSFDNEGLANCVIQWL